MEDNLLITSGKPHRVHGRVSINIQRCKACELKGYRFIVADNNRCTGCVNCALVCPDAVISVFRTPVKKKTALS
jgi:NAD-dependent dihydropyrimidine dehydrogenase PreA subunit